MGDKGSLGFRSGRTDVIWLYTHCAGETLPTIAARAIEAARPRWRDEMYATRLALTELIGGIEEDTDWGVAAWTSSENEHPALIIDFIECNVRIIAADIADSWNVLSKDDRTDLFDAAPRATFKQYLHPDTHDPVLDAWEEWHE